MGLSLSLRTVILSVGCKHEHVLARKWPEFGMWFILPKIATSGVEDSIRKNLAEVLVKVGIEPGQQDRLQLWQERVRTRPRSH